METSFNMISADRLQILYNGFPLFQCLNFSIFLIRNEDEMQPILVIFATPSSQT